MSNSGNTLTYADAGVDIDRANKFVQAVKKIAAKTPRSGVMGEIGGFGGLFSLNLAEFKRPVLVSSTDGVGTKLKIAYRMDRHDTVGIDLVAMCVNDVLVQGAKPLFFLDYLAMGCLNQDTAQQIVAGVAEGCRQAQCALIAGETAEMPGVYKDKEYDLAGFSVGIVDNDRIIDGSDIRVGHKLVGIASSGLHSNGYSLVRKVCFDILKLDVDSYVPELGKALGEELLTPTKIYSETVMRLVKDLPIHGLAHITGGGIMENILRVVPASCGLVIRKKSWEAPPIFSFIQSAGNIEDREMMRTFNNGIGLVAVVPDEVASDVVALLSGMGGKSWIIGEVVAQRKSDKGRIRWA